MVPSQTREFRPLARESLAREGNLLLRRLGWATGPACRLYRLAWVRLGGDLGVLGGVIGDSGLENIDILVSWPRLKHG